MNRKEPKNVIVRHYDKRVKGKDQQGNLNHLNPSHILSKNAFFNGRVSVAREFWGSLSDEAEYTVESSGLHVQYMHVMMMGL